MIRVTLVSLAIAGLALGASPTITELRPRGAQSGRPFLLTVAGRDIPEGATVSSSMPASFTPAIPSADTPGRMQPGRVATFLVEPKPDLTPGVYTIRLNGSNGLSNILFFSVGEYPEIEEEESGVYSPPNRNDTIEDAQPVQSAPILVNGTLRGPERDLFRVSGKTGERRVFEVDARTCGSAIDPVLRILDGAGRQLARSDDGGAGLDARVEFTFPKDGYYYVEVRDARFSTQAQNFYRLRMGSYSFAGGIFPLGAKRGDNAEVTFFGGNLASPVKVNVTPGPADFLNVALPGSPTAPFRFATSDLPELVEPADSVPVPSVINGRLLAPGEVDRYTFDVRPGEHLLFETQARELGTSKVEAVITVYDQSGKKLDSAGDKPLPEDVFAVQGTSRTSNDPFLNVTVPDGVHKISLAIEDLAQRGGASYGYRIVTRRQDEDFSLAISTPQVNIPAGGSAFVPVTADRRGYNGPIQLTVADLPKGVRAEGGMIPREYVDPNNTRTLNRRGVLILTADAGVEMPLRDLVIYGEGKLAGGSVLRRRATGPAVMIGVAGATDQGVVDRQRAITAPWLGFDLPAALTTPPPATLAVRQKRVTRMEEGDKFEFEFEWTLLAGDARPPRDLAVDIIGARDIRVTNQQRTPGAAMSRTITGTFEVNTSKATDAATYDMIVRGRVQSDSGAEEVYARPIPFVVAEWSEKVNVSSR